MVLLFNIRKERKKSAVFIEIQRGKKGWQNEGVRQGASIRLKSGEIRRAVENYFVGFS